MLLMKTKLFLQVTLWSCIRDTSSSNLCRSTGCLDWRQSWFVCLDRQIPE